MNRPVTKPSTLTLTLTRHCSLLAPSSFSLLLTLHSSLFLLTPHPLPPPLSASPSGVVIRVLVQPRASRTEVVGLHGDFVRIRLAAPPVDGAANEELVRFLAGVLRVSRGSVAIGSGQASRRKVVTVAGVTPEEAAQRLHLGG